MNEITSYFSVLFQKVFYITFIFYAFSLNRILSLSLKFKKFSETLIYFSPHILKSYKLKTPIAVVANLKNSVTNVIASEDKSQS